MSAWTELLLTLLMMAPIGIIFFYAIAVGFAWREGASRPFHIGWHVFKQFIGIASPINEYRRPPPEPPYHWPGMEKPDCPCRVCRDVCSRD